MTILNLSTRNKLSLLILFCLSPFEASDFGVRDGLKELIGAKKLAQIFVMKEQLELKFKTEKFLTPKIKNQIHSEIGVSHEEMEQSKQMLGDDPNVGEFLGVLFFPHNSFRNTIKTNFNQLSFFERALVLISADLGFKPARNIIVLGNNEKVNLSAIPTGQDLYQLLSIPFAAENGMVIRKAKEILNAPDKQDFFYRNLSAAEPAAINLTILVNAGHVYKSLKRQDLSLDLFNGAKNHGSRRGAIEYGFTIIKQGLERAKEFINILAPPPSSSLPSPLNLEHYAYWKLAQFHRYVFPTAHGVIPRDLVTANDYYLRALPGGTEFPEIFYDAGDFAEYFAHSQTDIRKRVEALEQACNHFRLAAENGIGEAYRKQVEISKEISILTSTDTSREVMRLATEAAKSYFFHAGDLLGGKGAEKPKTSEWADLEVCIAKYVNLLTLVKKCPISF